MRFAALALIAVAAPPANAAGSAAPHGFAAAAAPTTAPVTSLAPGRFDVRDLDPTCRACSDFYRFATGGWERRNPIPPEYSSYGTFTQLYERNLAVLHGLLDRAATTATSIAPAPEASAPEAAGATTGASATPAASGDATATAADTAAPVASAPLSNDARLGTYYAACMDEASIEAAGTHPLDAEFARVAAVADVPGLVAEIAHVQRGAAPGTPFDYASTPDPKDSTRTIGDLGQDGLSLPERDYYVNASPASAALRAKFVAHAAKVFALLGDDAATAGAEAASVLAFETRLARASFTNVQLRDVAKTTNHFTVSSLQGAAPATGWSAYFAAAGAPQTTDVNVDEPSYFKALDAMLGSMPLADWKTYLRWRIVNAASPALPKAFVDERFAFDSILSGSKQQQPRWKRCVSATERAMPEALGALFVKSRFSPQAKARALAMVDNLQATLRDDFSTLPWMSPSTRTTAIAKLDVMRKKIGYPDKPRDYSAIVPQPHAYLADRYAAEQFAWNFDMGKIGKATDRGEWGFPAQTVNAEYNPTTNDITFPAGILQPPFYDVTNDDALNYGAIGAVIGHEMTHGFDDQGRLYDGAGNQREWYAPADVKRFDARASCVSDLYDTLPVDAHQNQKGRLVLGEAIADLGGTTIAYRAFERAQAGKPKTKLQGYTPEQRFFLAYANVWAENVRPEAARLQANTDVHALGRNRVIGTLQNMPEFARVWACPLAAKMVRPPARRCSIW